MRRSHQLFACSLVVACLAIAAAGGGRGTDRAQAATSSSASLRVPLRLAVYYPWFPETWPRPDGRPGLFSRYHPTLGRYRSGNVRVIRRHIAAMRYGRIQGGLSSWWGRGSRTDRRVPLLLREAARTPFRWGIYYEPEGTGDPSSQTIAADLTYLRSRYGSHRGALRIGGRLVVFVYAGPGDGCAMARRWRAGSVSGVYVVLKVFPGYRSCDAQPVGWHEYAPAGAEVHHGNTYSISPGFFKADESSPRLARSVQRFRRSALRMVRARPRFQLITTFNEWGEGTAVESAREWRSSSGFGRYLDVLHAIPRSPR